MSTNNLRWFVHYDVVRCGQPQVEHLSYEWLCSNESKNLEIVAVCTTEEAARAAARLLNE